MAFNRNAALPLQIHIIQYLSLRIALRNGFCKFQQAIGKGAFAMINMGDDTKIAYMFHQEFISGAAKLSFLTARIHLHFYFSQIICNLENRYICLAMPIISARNICKAYNHLQVLKGIDFDIEPGEIVSIVGASGAGKSTLLHILGTLDKADAGNITWTVNNQSVNLAALSEKKIAGFRNTYIGFIFQFHHLLPEFTALENVCIPAFIAGTPKKEAEEKARELLAYLGLADRLAHKPSELSGGEQQRVAVVRALINNPAVIMADEPSGNLDSKAARELHELFYNLRKEFRQTFIIVTHNAELADMADRKLTMQDGLIEEKNSLRSLSF